MFVGFKMDQVESDSTDYFDQAYQLGVAPYLGDFGDLHTWLMIKAKKNSVTSEWSVFPLLRLFKRDVMLELGYNNKTSWDAHLMYRF